MRLTKFLSGILTPGPYYVRLRRERLSVRDASGGGMFDDEPLVALTEGRPSKVRAIGAQFSRAVAGSVNPFCHPRVLIADFVIAEKLLAHVFRVVSGHRLFTASPIVVMHVTEDLEGGLASIERRAIRELAEGAGARKVYLREGRELTDEELRCRVYRQAV